MASIHINIINDFSFGVLTHNAIQVPMPAPVINVSVEMIATQLWTLGYLMNQNKFAKKVVHKNMWIVQDGHDSGMMIPDVTFPIFPNLMYIVNWPFSSRKITFAASTVKMDGQATGCAQTIGLPPLPMMTCGDPVSAPTSIVIFNYMNNVTVGFTLKDFLLGLLDIAVSIIIDVLFECISGKFKWNGPGEMLSNYSSALSKGAREALSEAAEAGIEATARATWRSVGEEFAKKLFPINLKSAAKRGASVLGGLLTSSARGNPTAKVGVGGPFLGAEGGYESEKGWVGQGQAGGEQRSVASSERNPDGSLQVGGASWGEGL